MPQNCLQIQQDSIRVHNILGRTLASREHELERNLTERQELESEIIFTDPISSQLIKYLSNAYLPLRLSFVNEASRLIDSLSANQSDVLKGVGLDSRIGDQYFRPSPGWGGSCFPKDVMEIQQQPTEVLT